MRDADRWADLLGMDDGQLEERLGPPDTRQPVDGDLWLVFETTAGRLRVRCHAQEEPRVASWTLALAEPTDTLREAVEPLGLWPAASPDIEATGVVEPLARRALTAPGGEGLVSLTATVRGHRFTHVSVFDEAPDWL
jgi:hypothetical protein